MQHYTKIMIACGLLLLFVSGCGLDSSLQENNRTIEYTNVSSNELNQQISNQAKHLFNENNNISSVNAVNTTKKLVIAIEVPQMKRFQLKKIQKSLAKEMKKEFSTMDVHLSADKKIVLELTKLEEKIASHSITKKQLEKEIDQIISLMKEQT